MSAGRRIGQALIAPLLAVVVALVISALVILLIGEDPATAVKVMFDFGETPAQQTQAIVTVGFVNGTTSLFEARRDRYIHDVFASPLRWWEIDAALVGGGVVRGLAVGAGVLLGGPGSRLGGMAAAYGHGLLDDPPDPVDQDRAGDGRLVDAVHRDLAGETGTASPTAVRMIWTADHLDALRRLQPALLGPARGLSEARR